MSAKFKNSKKKLMQTELRRLMNEHKTNKKDVKPIDSPLAKLNENGQLTCILCKSIVRSAAVWPVHINSKQHKENIEIAKKLKEKTNNFTVAAKRPLSPQPETQPKKLKGILKKPGGENSSADDTEAPLEQTANNGQKDSLPTDFFDSKAATAPLPTRGNKNQVQNAENKKDSSKGAIPEENAEGEVLPEGFFDDPKLDAKARNQEYKDPIEEEWEKFQKAIREADDESAAIIAEDQDEATAERQIDEIDEQIKHLSKVLVLEKKKQEITVTSSNKSVDKEHDSDVDESDFDEFLDWRSKQSFK